MEYININDTDATLWTDLYKPKSIKDLVGNRTSINMIVNWLNTFKENKNKIVGSIKTKICKKKQKNVSEEDDNQDESSEIAPSVITKSSQKKNGPFSCLLLMGNHGAGKTCSIYAILSELNYDVQTINFSRIQKTDNIKDIVRRIKFSNSIDVMSMLDFAKARKKVLVIDEIESLTSKIDVSCIMALIENNDAKWHYPIIFISNNHHNKSINDIRKKSLEIRMESPTNEALVILLNRIIGKEKIKFENSRTQNIIIEHSQHDYRRLLNILQDVKYIYGNELITMNNVKEYCNLVKKKDIDYDLFRASSDIIHNYIGIDNTLKYHETDKVNLPLMVQENYIRGVIDSYNCKDKLKVALNVTKSLSRGDIIENYIYGNQNWSIHEAHGYYSCVYPSYIMKKYIGDENKYKLTFPNDLNRTSIKMINKKNINKISELLKNMNITDYIYINEIIQQLAHENRITELIELFSGYGLSMENIDKLLKIDKIKTTKINLTAKQKKEIQKKLDVK